MFFCPCRIISLGPAITEEIYLLGAEDKLVGNTIYCQTPSDAKNKEKVGTIRDVNVEKIINLKPDLVLATPVTSGNDIEKLKGLKIKVISFGTAKSFIEVCEQFLELGKIAGKEERAASIIGEAASKINFIKTRVANFPKPKVFVQVGAKPLYTANAGFINDYIVCAGGINIAFDSSCGSDYSAYSREQVVEKNPDVILIVTMGIVGEAEKDMWKKFSGINAVRNNRIYVIDSHKLCSPTPVSFAEMLGEIAALLHPEETR